MNISAYREAFSESHHSPGLRRLKGILPIASEITDFCVPVNIGFPTPDFIGRLMDDLLDRLKYYPSEPKAIAQKFATFVQTSPEQLIAGNGSTELFYNLLSSMGPGLRLLTCVPTFGRWTDAPRNMRHQVIGVPRREVNQFDLDPDELVGLAKTNKINLVIISNPNNPTGRLMSRSDLLNLIERLEREVDSLRYVVVDESFLDFSNQREKESLIRDVGSVSKLIVLKSLGKSFGLHGTRMGVMVAEARVIESVAGHVPYWNVNGVAESVIDLMPEFRTEFETSLAITLEATRYLYQALKVVPGLTAFPSDANFVYVRFNHGLDPVRLRDELLIRHGLFLRSCGNKEAATAHEFRIATRTRGDVDRLISSLVECGRR